jgi:histidinol-phosphate aminotransferase
MGRIWKTKGRSKLKTRKIFSNFTPYSWELSNAQIASLVGIESSKVVRMDTNASPYLPTKSLTALSRKVEALRVNDYPDTSYSNLRKELARYCKRTPENFVVTNGADEALDIIAKTLLDPGDEIIVPTPSYTMYKVVSEISGARVVSAPRLPNFELDVERIRKKVNPRTKAIFACSPNNPTGNSASLGQVRELLELGRDLAVVVDEAYYEFSGRTVANLIQNYDRVAIVRTFSKAFSMAGVRVGYMIAARESVEKFNLVRPPNSVGVISLFLAQNALRERAEMRKNVGLIVRERQRMIERMRTQDTIRVFPSEANFILFRIMDGSTEEVHKRLMKRGIVLRKFSDSRVIKNCLRVTVNTPELNDRFLRSLAEEIDQLRTK